MEGNAPPKLSISDLDDVRLIVKSANQQFDDLIIHSEPLWTIRKLKTHLSQVYPSNPTVPEQKLIYSGQLLSDELVLKDILRSYKDVETENHIFHLVYTPKISATKTKLPEPKPLVTKQLQQQNLEKPTTQVIPPSSSTDGLRHRNVASSSSSAGAAATSNTTETPLPALVPSPAPALATTTTATAPQMQQQMPNMAYQFPIPQAAGPSGCLNNFYNMAPFMYPGQISYGTIPEQQVAVQNWVQQIYANYMDQCLKMANATINAAEMQPNAPSIPMFMPFPQYMPTSFPIPQSSTPTAANIVPPVESDGPGTSRAARATFAPRVIPVIQPVAQPQPAVAPTIGTAASPAPAPAPAPAENVEQPQPRFPNIVQEEQDNRDWLDSFYSVTRLMALLVLVYFYSSPLRCLAVAIIAVGIYLYHTGFFQARRQRQVNINNNQNVNDNNVPAVDPAQAQNDAPQAAAVPATADPIVPADSEPLITSVTSAEADQSTTSLIAFVRTFVVSFFASLLPETPAL